MCVSIKSGGLDIKEREYYTSGTHLQMMKQLKKAFAKVAMPAPKENL